MYLEKIKINKFHVLKDVEICFQAPRSATADRDTGNIVNVLAGINGCGKTSLLEAIFEGFSNQNQFFSGDSGEFYIGDLSSQEVDTKVSNSVCISKDNFQTLSRETQAIEQNQDLLIGNARLIFLPSAHGFSSPQQSTQSLSFGFGLFPPERFAYKVDISPFTLRNNIEAFIKDYVLAEERNSLHGDPQKRATEAIGKFNSHFLDVKLLTKLTKLQKVTNRPLFCNVLNEEVTIDQLSDGEKQLHMRVVELLRLQPNNSIILIDEPEIGLHPEWQQKILSIYRKIGRGNQFIVTTHSPQIIANTRYEDLVVLHKQQEKIVSMYPTQPPTGVDANSVLSEIMGVEEILPIDVLELRQRYRQFVNQKKETSPEAEMIKEKLLQRESIDSKFMQEMRLLLRLRNRG